MARTSQKSSPAAKAAKATSMVGDIINGRILSAEFYARYWGPVLLGIFLVLVYIGNRYVCLTQMEEIRRLEKQLQIEETERIRVRSAYMSRIRESEMHDLVVRMNLGLSVQDQPPYTISSDRRP